MAAISRLGKQIAELTAMLTSIAVPHALIGGLALASHNVIRATQDVDLLVPLDQADEIDTQLKRIGYQCAHRSSNAGNYVRGTERVDFLYASRPIALRLLAAARELSTSLGVLRVISLEGLIGFKLQGLVNDARRTQDLEDIRALLLAGDGGITPPVASEEDPYRTLDDLMVVVEALCPNWPQRGVFVESGAMLL